MSRSTGKKYSEAVLDELKEKSANGLELAKKTILAEKIRYEKLRDALEHYALHWNDFTHPGLFAISCEVVGGNLRATVRVQSAIALMAAAFDIHDDIIDNSDKKHGVPTVFGKYGKDIALLLGNALLIESFTVLDQSLRELHPEKTREILDILKSSLFELGNAHALELNLKNRTDATPEECMEIVKMKAASIEADMRIGAIVGGGSIGQVEALARYGRILGVLATLREEFVDVFDIEELNQRISEYPPIPVLYAMQDTYSRTKIKRLLAKQKLTDNDIEELTETVLSSRTVQELKKEMRILGKEAASLISQVGSNTLRNILQKLALAALDDL